MFEPFLTAFELTKQGQGGDWPASYQRGWAELMGYYGGSTFARGLYRLHTAESAADAAPLVFEAFPDLRDHIACFGYDWLGRQFGLDLRAPEADSVRMLEPGTGEVLAIPSSFLTFHNEELVEHADAALASAFFDAWAAANPDALPLPQDRCAGYRVPLFLSGLDAIENLEEIDLDVYWSLSAQLIGQTRRLKSGQRISDVRIG